MAGGDEPRYLASVSYPGAWVIKRFRAFARGMLFVAVVLSTGVAVAAEDRPALGFSKLLFRLEDDAAIGIAREDYRVHVLEALRSSGFNAVGAEDLVFERDRSELADYLLGGTVRELECRSLSRGLVNCRIGIRWQLLDVRADRVTYEVLTRHVEYSIGEKQEKIFGRKLVVGALASLTRRPAFKAAITAKPSAAESSNHVQASYRACESAADPLPASFETAARATVFVRSGNAFGSGFFLGPDGLVLTAAHVLTSGDVELGLRDGTRLAARPIRVSRARDVALLLANRPNDAPLPCLPANLEPKQPGTDVYAIGAPASKELAFSLTRGIVSGVRVIDGVAWLQTDASVSPGNSGGPLIDGAGRLVGIVSRKVVGGGIEGVAFGIPIEVALAELRLEAGAVTDAKLLAAPPEPVGATKAATSGVQEDRPDPVPSLDPEGDRQRAERARRKQNAPPDHVQALRWGGFGLGLISALGIVATSGKVEKDEMTRQEYEDARRWNDISWLGTAVGAVMFSTSWFLPSSKPRQERAPRVAPKVGLAVGPAHAELSLGF